MNRSTLQKLADDWMIMAAHDLEQKVKTFMAKTSISKEELCHDLGVTPAYLDALFNGRVACPMDLFVKLMIVTGNVLEIQPMGDAPFVDHIKKGIEREIPISDGEDDFEPRPYRPYIHHVDNPFKEPNPTFKPQNHVMGGPRTPRPAPRFRPFEGTRPTPSENGDMENDDSNKPHFERMTIQQLKEIIQNKLWDDEIDVKLASRDELVDFLNEKNRRMENLKKRQAMERDPQLNGFKERLRESLDKNPELLEFIKDLIK